jgi:transposase-like protein
MASNLQNPIFTDETKAREWLEARVWPQGPICPHCGTPSEGVTKLEGGKHRPGLYQCNGCREQFTVTVKTVFERSKIPLTKWLAALFLLTASKKGVSAHQIHRSLGISYKSAWFMMHRLREALRTGGLAPMGGTTKIVEVDKTVIGKLEGAPKHTYQGYGQQWRNTVLALVERGGNVRTFHVDGTTTGALLPILRPNIQAETFVMTDGASWYRGLANTFDTHEAVNHTAKEYVRRDFSWHGGQLQTVKITTTRSKAISQSSSAACAASTSIAKRSTCIAISRNLTSATTLARPLVTATTSALNSRQLASKANASLIDGLVSKTKTKRIKRQAKRFLEWRAKNRPKPKRVPYWQSRKPP